ncbi:hypothetical protein OESDEN_01718 [Oesophagostomum dentatum]|uniref:Uncharacterized protein n=1 Tax=Oesophagostomum dentatum TaxID=61180 RepID=A0A0B1TQB1_OESDE|nr:hypothetical protein OESDEN_01718 [Oesophagostomum dentatum]
MKKENRRWTLETPNGRIHAEIEYILTNRRWCLLDVSVVPFFCSGSDHSPSSKEGASGIIKS